MWGWGDDKAHTENLHYHHRNDFCKKMGHSLVSWSISLLWRPKSRCRVGMGVVIKNGGAGIEGFPDFPHLCKDYSHHNAQVLKRKVCQCGFKLVSVYQLSASLLGQTGSLFHLTV